MWAKFAGLSRRSALALRSFPDTRGQFVDESPRIANPRARHRGESPFSYWEGDEPMLTCAHRRHGQRATGFGRIDSRHAAVRATHSRDQRVLRGGRRRHRDRGRRRGCTHLALLRLPGRHRVRRSGSQDVHGDRHRDQWRRPVRTAVLLLCTAHGRALDVARNTAWLCRFSNDRRCRSCARLHASGTKRRAHARFAGRHPSNETERFCSDSGPSTPSTTSTTSTGKCSCRASYERPKCTERRHPFGGGVSRSLTIATLILLSRHLVDTCRAMGQISSH